jgi:ankyrin repeat protein
VLARLGADIDAPNFNGITPVYIAAQEGQALAIRALAELGANLNAYEDGASPPVYIAAQEGHTEVVRVLGEFGADVNTRQFDGTTPLHVAALENHVQVVEVLVELGADSNSVKSNGMTPLHMAAQAGNVATITTLAALGAHLDAKTESGATPVHLVAASGRTDAITTLVHLRADVELPANDNSSPLIAALEFDQKEASHLLLDAGVTVKSCFFDDYSEQVTVNRVFIQGALSNFYTKARLVDTRGDRGDHINTQSSNGSGSGRGSSNADSTSDDTAKLCLFSLTRLMSRLNHASHKHTSPLRDAHSTDESAKNKDTNDKDEEEEDSSHDQDAVLDALQTDIAISMWHQRPPVPWATIERMQATPYALRRRMVRVAWRVHQSTLQLDGARLSAADKARRYAELVCFFLNPSTLDDVASLRMTCQSNHERRRFPVCSGSYCELEANIIEAWLANYSSRFVSTAVIHALVAIHRQH